MRYALIEISTGLVVNVIELDEPTDWLPPEGYEVVRSDSASPGDTYLNGEFVPPPPPPEPEPDLVQLANTARNQRDYLLRTIYDSGTQMVRRELDMTEDAAYIVKLKAKLVELHHYAIDLQAIPTQSGFPLTINWPDQPSEAMQ